MRSSSIRASRHSLADRSRFVDRPLNVAVPGAAGDLVEIGRERCRFFSGPDAIALTVNAMAVSASALTMGVLGAVMAVALVQERHLFAYFKDR